MIGFVGSIHSACRPDSTALTRPQVIGMNHSTTAVCPGGQGSFRGTITGLNTEVLIVNVVGLPQFNLVAVGIHDVHEFAIAEAFDRIADRDALLPEFCHQHFQICDPVIDHEVLAGGLEVFGAGTEGAPLGKALAGRIGRLPPFKDRTIGIDAEPEMLAVPLPDFFGVSALEEDAADAGDFSQLRMILRTCALVIDA